MSIRFSEVQEQALITCDAIHRERRILLKQEIGRMVLFFADQPSLLAPNIQVQYAQNHIITSCSCLYISSLVYMIILMTCLDSRGLFGLNKLYHV